MRSLEAIICGALLTLPSSAMAQHQGSEAEAAIRAGTQAWEAAWNAGDAAALAALYASDATVMAPGSEPAVGRAAIEQAYRSALDAADGAQNEVETLEVMASGDWAAEVGRFVMTSATGSHLDHGRYTAIWKKVDGRWMLYRDMWNSSMAH